jgi:hypothetical protein
MVLPVATVTLTSHLFTFFPNLKGRALQVDATTVADVVRELEKLAPGFAFYVCDERNRLRKHVNIFVDKQMIGDRQALSDRLNSDSEVFVAQALSGG